VIDLLENPNLAKRDQIMAVPTLVRKLPPPIKKIIGDLSTRKTSDWPGYATVEMTHKTLSHRGIGGVIDQ
jgi:hypothetical protein